MNFKKVLILLLIVSSFTSQAQKRGFFNHFENLQWFDQQKFSYGYTIGLVQYGFKTSFKTPYEHIEVQDQGGFSVGILGTYNYNKNLSLRFEPNLAFGTRKLTFKNLITDFDRNREVKSTYINLPLLIKFNANRHLNMRPYLAAGVGLAYNLNSNEDNPDDNSQGVFRMNKNSYFYELAFGVEFYTANFKVTPSIRGIFNFKNEVIPDADQNSPWTSNIDEMMTRAIMFKLTFE
jgi:hypothetical protein